MKQPRNIAGIDGCRAGWLVVAARSSAHRLTDRVCFIAPTIAGATAQLSHDALIAVDIPIGLLDEPRAGGRDIDRALRELLGPRRASVFSPPPRCLLDCHDYAHALTICRSRGDATALSKQSWNILRKIRECDALVRALAERHPPRPRLHEVHPEWCWGAMRSGDPHRPEPARHPKRTPEGRAERLRLLREHDLEPLAGAVSLLSPAVAAMDDLLDAHAALWTARRLERGEAVPLIERAEPDGVGVPISMHC